MDRKYYLSPCGEAQRACSVGSAPPLHENPDTWSLCYGLRIVPPDLGTEKDCVLTVGLLIDFFLKCVASFPKEDHCHHVVSHFILTESTGEGIVLKDFILLALLSPSAIKIISAILQPLSGNFHSTRGLSRCEKLTSLLESY